LDLDLLYLALLFEYRSVPSRLGFPTLDVRRQAVLLIGCPFAQGVICDTSPSYVAFGRWYSSLLTDSYSLGVLYSVGKGLWLLDLRGWSRICGFFW
jgi:hypothetical protein